MVVAVVGSLYSGRDLVVKFIREFMNRPFEVVKFNSTRYGGGSFKYVTRKEFDSIPCSSIFYTAISKDWDLYFVRREQLQYADCIFCCSDPAGVAGIDTLGCTYAIVFVDTTRGRVKRRSKQAGVAWSSIKEWYNKNESSLRDFKHGGSYNLRICDGELTNRQFKRTVLEFCKELKSWEQNRREDEMHPPFVRHGGS